jgi:chromosome segregation ATPase
MSSHASPEKDSLLGQIWSISTTLTEEAMTAASAKAKESGFDLNRGLIPLPESFINLSSARAVLEDAIEKQKLVQLPISAQKALLLNLESIQRSLQGLATGIDEIVNLTTAVEALNTAIWTYGLHNLSDQVLGYQKKLNQLKNQEVQASKLMEQLESAQRTAERVVASASEAEQKRNEISALLEQIKQFSAGSASLLDQIKDAQTQTAALFATVQQNEKQSGELMSNIKTASNELASLDASIRKFYGEVDEYRRKINQTNDDASRLITDSEATVKKFVEDTTAQVAQTAESLEANANTTADTFSNEVTAKLTEAEDRLSSLVTETESAITQFQQGIEEKLAISVAAADSSTKKLLTETQQEVQDLKDGLAKESEETIANNQKKTESLIEELEKLKELIREQLQQATGFTLFGAFQSRQNQIAKAKQVWVYALAALVLISVGVTFWIGYEAKFFSVHSFAFWVKLSLTIPIGYAITFCTVQYGKERRLEEEYAFKSSISVSLNPYRDLVLSILEKDGTADLSKYTDFVIGSVNNVFTSPTERALDGEDRASVDKALKDMLKPVAELAGTMLKASK